MRLTTRILAAWPLWRLAHDQRERAWVACYCDLCPAEVAVLETLAANVAALPPCDEWIDDVGMVPAVKPGVVEGLLAGLDVSALPPRAAAHLIDLPHRAHRWALAHALTRYVAAQATRTAPCVTEPGSARRGWKLDQMRALVRSGRLSLDRPATRDEEREIAAEIASTPLTVRYYLQRLRRERR